MTSWQKIMKLDPPFDLTPAQIGVVFCSERTNRDKLPGTSKRLVKGPAGAP